VEVARNTSDLAGLLAGLHHAQDHLALSLGTFGGAAIHTHRDREVGWADPAAIDALHAQDFLGPFGGLQGFDLHRQKDLIIGPVFVFGALVGGSTTKRALATGRVAR